MYCTMLLNFCWGQGSYAPWRCVNIGWAYKLSMSSTLVQQYSITLNTAMWSQCMAEWSWFLHGTATCVMPANQYACIMCLSLSTYIYILWAACTSIYWKTYSYTDQSSKLFVCINECTVVLIDFRFIHKSYTKAWGLHVVWLHHQLFCSTNPLYITHSEVCGWLVQVVHSLVPSLSSKVTAAVFVSGMQHEH